MDLTDVRLLVRDFAGSVEFWRATVGLERTVLVGDTYAEFRTPTGSLGVYRRDLMEAVIGEAAGGPTADTAVLVFRVEDVDAEHERLAAAGVEFLTGPHDQETWGLRVAHFRDPEGNLVELYHSLGRSQT